MSNKLLKVSNLTVEFFKKVALEDITLELPPGVHAILGPNSSGKSTLLKAIASLIPIKKGEVIYDGISISKLPPKKRAQIVGYCWQNPYQGFFEDSVKREIEFILKNTNAKASEEVLEILGINKLYEKNPFRLSGGEARRVSIASIVVADQPIILLDEPFNDMDLDGYLSIVNLLSFFRKRNKTVIIALNNSMHLNLVKPDDVFVIYSGRIVEKTTLRELNDDVLEKYNIVTRKLILESAC
ncbi:MAG: ABC transporter ATP-binding protein [Fervidicoccus fontis]|uniref:ABC transporter ATP-binding protein n=1 Tax=Fervidicoccus fontis TaxID=683846 RepID=A0A7C2ZWZ9_9CREN|nr:MAG: ABC transporter ATP-binding protein [Fervidicoccus fontis]HEW64339.1 ABC transporter ATP-binding protein [Fervidicoccus fontis]